MVKNKSVPLLSSSYSDPKLSLESNLKSQILTLSEPTCSTFIIHLLKYTGKNPICKSIASAYTILLTSLILQESNQNPIQKSSALQSIRKILSKLFNLHKSKSILKSSNPLFLHIQTTLNKSSQLIDPNYQNTETFHCCQLLNVLSSIPFSLSMITLWRILNKERYLSVFSFFTNKNAPFLPDLGSLKTALVLDLDETLGHFDGKSFLVRPGAGKFIEKVAEKYELVLFTSAMEVYANAALELVDMKKLIMLRLFRQHLFMDSDGFVKDLRVLGRRLDRVVILDNDKRLFRNQPDNGIEIKSWTGDVLDRELSKIGEALSEVAEGENAFEIVKRVQKLL